MDNIFISNAVKALEKVLKKRDKLIPLHEPEFSGSENYYLKECIGQ